MKVMVSEKCAPESPAYPCLKISQEKRLVLFTAPRDGVCLSDPNGNNRVGERSQAWCEKECFYPFHGSISISVE